MCPFSSVVLQLLSHDIDYSLLSLLASSCSICGSCGVGATVGGSLGLLSNGLIHGDLSASLHLDLCRLRLLHHCRRFILLAREEIFGLLFVFFDDRLEFVVFLEPETLYRWLDVFLLNARVDKEFVIGLELLNLDHSIDHLRGDSLAAHELVHLLLCLEFGRLKFFDRVNALFTCQFLRLSVA